MVLGYLDIRHYTRTWCTVPLDDRPRRRVSTVTVAGFQICFLEIRYVDDIIDELEAAKAGMISGEIVVSRDPVDYGA